MSEGRPHNDLFFFYVAFYFFHKSTRVVLTMCLVNWIRDQLDTHVELVV